MKMNQNERRFDFHGLGAALKRAREEKGWTQAYVAELVDRDSRTIMNIENKGHYPSFDLFVKLITMFDVSVDQFIHADGGARSSSCRKHIDVLLNSMNEKELVVIEATAEGIKKARETEVPEFFCAILGAVAKWQAITNPIILFLLTNRIKTIMRHILVFPKIVKERIEGGANEKAVLGFFTNCPFVCINFDFFWLNKARQLYMDF